MALVTAPLTKFKPYLFIPVRSPKLALNHSSVIRNSDHNGEWFGLKTSCRRESLNLYCIRNKNGADATMGINDRPLSEAETEPERIVLSDVVVKRERNVVWGRKWNLKEIGIAGALLALHVLCLFAPFYFNWRAFWVAFWLGKITGVLGITLCFHRNLSHRSFKLPKWFEHLFAYCGVLALQRLVCRTKMQAK